MKGRQRRASLTALLQLGHLSGHRVGAQVSTSLSSFSLALCPLHQATLPQILTTSCSGAAVSRKPLAHD